MHDNSYRSLEKCSASSCCLHAMHATALAVAQLKETECQRAALAVALDPYEEKKAKCKQF